ncbi:hypothetical protein AVEN_65281-1 [Araneus ventricosus]|uniref:Uncharacterized protein n=1 Tax=Araneus ventricosus TaxID=182803 RepID=A0A4Y2AHN5_ARAVE|nr:hypothetical protein AVEN_65281-1 [Araneus ventricosus]
MVAAKTQKKNFSHRIVMGDEKWICYDNPKYKKPWFGPDEPSSSMAKLNNHGALYLVGSGGFSVLWAAPTQRNHHWGILSATIDATELSIEAKNKQIRRQHKTMGFSSTTTIDLMSRKR